MKIFPSLEVEGGYTLELTREEMMIVYASIAKSNMRARNDFLVDHGYPRIERDLGYPMYCQLGKDLNDPHVK